MFNLPKLATIGTIEYPLFDNNYDHPDRCHDLVKCNNCCHYGLVDNDTDVCPDCDFAGGLMDIDESDLLPR